MPKSSLFMNCAGSFLMLAVPGAVAHAQSPSDELPASTRERTTVRESSILQYGADTGVALFFGMDGGYAANLAPTLPNVYGKKSGFYLAGKALVSVYPKNWVFDLGLGWTYTQLAGYEVMGDTPSATPPPGATEKWVGVATGAASVDISPRFRLSHHWQIGPVAQLLFGRDVGFSSSSDSQQTFAALAGLQLMYGVPERTLDLRYGIHALTDLNIASGQLVWLGGTIQFGLPVVKPDTLLRARELATTRDRIERNEVERVVPKVVVREIVKSILDAHDLNFQPGLALLDAPSQSLLLDYAKVLAAQHDNWSKLTVEGHVNDAHEARTNVRLSAARAFAVRAALVAGGVPGDKVDHIGLGASRPLEPANAKALRNQRIELNFMGVSRPRELNSALELVRKKNAVPETCQQEGGCK